MSTKYYKFAKQYLPKVRKKIEEYPELKGMDVKIIRRLQDDVKFFDFFIGKNSICRLSFNSDRRISFKTTFTRLDYMLYGWIEGGNIEGDILIDFGKLKLKEIEDFYNKGEFILERGELKDILNKIERG